MMNDTHTPANTITLYSSVPGKIKEVLNVASFHVDHVLGTDKLMSGLFSINFINSVYILSLFLWR